MSDDSESDGPPGLISSESDGPPPASIASESDEQPPASEDSADVRRRSGFAYMLYEVGLSQRALLAWRRQVALRRQVVLALPPERPTSATHLAGAPPQWHAPDEPRGSGSTR